MQKRLQQSATDIAFNPLLADRCAAERSHYCGTRQLVGTAVIDCLTDHRWATDVCVWGRGVMMAPRCGPAGGMGCTLLVGRHLLALGLGILHLLNH